MRNCVLWNISMVGKVVFYTVASWSPNSKLWTSRVICFHVIFHAHAPPARGTHEGITPTCCNRILRPLCISADLTSSPPPISGYCKPQSIKTSGISLSWYIALIKHLVFRISLRSLKHQKLWKTNKYPFQCFTKNHKDFSLKPKASSKLFIFVSPSEDNIPLSYDLESDWSCTCSVFAVFVGHLYALFWTLFHNS